MDSQYLDRCRGVILDATSGVTPETATKRAGDRWSVVEIVEHLQRAFSGTAKGFERCIEKGTPLATGATAPFSPGPHQTSREADPRAAMKYGRMSPQSAKRTCRPALSYHSALAFPLS